MRVIETLTLDRTGSCGSRSPVYIMLQAIRNIRECGDAVELRINDYDWYLTLKYILQRRTETADLKLRDEGKENDFMKILVVKEC